MFDKRVCRVLQRCLLQNNAGTNRRASTLRAARDPWTEARVDSRARLITVPVHKQVVELNLLGTMHATRAAVQIMKDNPGPDRGALALQLTVSA